MAAKSAKKTAAKPRAAAKKTTAATNPATAANNPTVTAKKSATAANPAVATAAITTPPPVKTVTAPTKPAVTTKSPVTVAPAAHKEKVEAAKPTARKTIPSIEFKLFAPEASEVFVAGDFNSWNTTEHRSTRSKDGTWKKKLKLKPGSYEYLFVVDGTWWTDPNNSKTTCNAFGSTNSVMEVR